MVLLLGPELSWRQMPFSALQHRGGRDRREKSEGVRKARAVICAKHSEMPLLTESVSGSGGGREGGLGHQETRICSFCLANYHQESSVSLSLVIIPFGAFSSFLYPNISPVSHKIM